MLPIPPGRRKSKLASPPAVEKAPSRRASLRNDAGDPGSGLVDEKKTSERLYNILTKDAQGGVSSETAAAADGALSSSPRGAGEDEAVSSSAKTAEGGERLAGAASSEQEGEEAANQLRRTSSKQTPEGDAGRQTSGLNLTSSDGAQAGQTAQVGEGSGAADGRTLALRRFSSTSAGAMPAGADEVPPTPEHERVERDRDAFVNSICVEETHPDVRRMIRRLYIGGQLAWAAVPEGKPHGKEKRLLGGQKSTATVADGEKPTGTTQQGGEGETAGDAGGDGAIGSVASEDAAAGAESEGLPSSSGSIRSLDVQICNSDESAHNSPSSALGAGAGLENEDEKLKRYLANRTKEQDAWVKAKVSEMTSRIHKAVDRRVETEGWARLQANGVLDEGTNRLRLKNMKRQKLRKELDKHMSSYLRSVRLEALKEWEDRKAQGIKNIEVEEKEGETDIVFRTLTKPRVANDPKKRAGQIPRFPPLKMSYSLPVDWKHRSSAFGTT